MGVDTGPLLAGAGIVGIAIGFGAQTLVRDIGGETRHASTPFTVSPGLRPGSQCLAQSR